MPLCSLPRERSPCPERYHFPTPGVPVDYIIWKGLCRDQNTSNPHTLQGISRRVLGQSLALFRGPKDCHKALFIFSEGKKIAPQAFGASFTELLHPDQALELPETCRATDVQAPTWII